MKKHITIFIYCCLFFIMVFMYTACTALPTVDTTDTKSTPQNNQTTIAGLAVRLSLPDLIQKSDAIVVGRVTRILPARLLYVAQLGHELPCTDVIIKTERCLLGIASSPEIAIQVWGGQIDGQTVSIEDSPVFKLDEEVALFLEKVPSASPPPEGITAENYFVVYGSAQGKYAVDNGSLIDREGNRIDLPELEQKIRSIRGG